MPAVGQDHRQAIPAFTGVILSRQAVSAATQVNRVVLSVRVRAIDRALESRDVAIPDIKDRRGCDPGEIGESER
jgi:hypothetical protein